MNWPDERYVRIYNRDTPDWMIWPWQSRALFPLLARKVDRAGVLELGRYGARGLAALVGLPVEVVEPGLAGLVEDGCVRVSESGRLLIRNFIEAQESASSDKARQAESRGRRRDVAAAQSVTARDDVSQNVTDGHETGPDVTTGHGTSQVVTPSLAVPSRAVPKEQRAADADPPPSLPGTATEPTEPPAVRPNAATVREAAITKVLAHWQIQAERSGWAIEGKGSGKRRTRIAARLDEGLTVEQLVTVADGMRRDGFLMGTDPKSRAGGYRDVETVYRDRPQCERLMALADGTAKSATAPARPRVPLVVAEPARPPPTDAEKATARDVFATFAPKAPPTGPPADPVAMREAHRQRVQQMEAK